MDLAALGLSDIGPVGQAALAAVTKGDKSVQVVRHALAASTYLDPSVASSMLVGRDIYVHRRALRRADDLDVVNRVAKGDGPNAVAALMNPGVDPDVVSAQARSEVREVALAAVLHPALPRDEARSVLTIGNTWKLTSYGGSSAERAIRGQALAHAHPWLAETPGAWSADIRRGLTQIADMDVETVLLLNKTCGGHWEDGDNHPALRGVDTQTSGRDLLDLGHPAADLLALERSDVTAAMVSAAFKRRTHVQRMLVDYYVLAKATSRFGPGIGYASRIDLSGTRTRAAGWAVPAGEYLGRVSDADMRDARSAARLLKNDRKAWDAFARLALGWEQTAADLARCAALL